MFFFFSKELKRQREANESFERAKTGFEFQKGTNS